MGKITVKFKDNSIAEIDESKLPAAQKAGAVVYSSPSPGNVFAKFRDGSLAEIPESKLSAAIGRGAQIFEPATDVTNSDVTEEKNKPSAPPAAAPVAPAAPAPAPKPAPVVPLKKATQADIDGLIPTGFRMRPLSPEDAELSNQTRQKLDTEDDIKKLVVVPGLPGVRVDHKAPITSKLANADAQAKFYVTALANTMKNMGWAGDFDVDGMLNNPETYKKVFPAIDQYFDSQIQAAKKPVTKLTSTGGGLGLMGTKEEYEDTPESRELERVKKAAIQNFKIKRDEAIVAANPGADAKTIGLKIYESEDPVSHSNLKVAPNMVLPNYIAESMGVNAKLSHAVARMENGDEDAVNEVRGLLKEQDNVVYKYPSVRKGELRQVVMERLSNKKQLGGFFDDEAAKKAVSEIRSMIANPINAKDVPLLKEMLDDLDIHSAPAAKNKQINKNASALGLTLDDTEPTLPGGIRYGERSRYNEEVKQYQGQDIQSTVGREFSSPFAETSKFLDKLAGFRDDKKTLMEADKESVGTEKYTPKRFSFRVPDYTRDTQTGKLVANPDAGDFQLRALPYKAAGGIAQLAGQLTLSELAGAGLAGTAGRAMSAIDRSLSNVVPVGAGALRSGETLGLTGKALIDKSKVIIPAFTMSYDHNRKDALNMFGSSPESSAKVDIYSMATATLEGLTELIGNPYEQAGMLKEAFSRNFKGEVADRIKALSISEIEKMDKSKMTKLIEASMKSAGKGIKNVTGESFEEFNNAVGSYATAALLGADVKDRDAMQEGLDAFVDAAASMSFLGAAGAYSGARNYYSNSGLAKQSMFNAAINADEYRDNINRSFAEGSLTEKERDEKINLVNTAEQAKKDWDQVKAFSNAKTPNAMHKAGVNYVVARANELALQKEHDGSTNPIKQKKLAAQITKWQNVQEAILEDGVHFNEEGKPVFGNVSSPGFVETRFENFHDIPEEYKEDARLLPDGEWSVFVEDRDHPDSSAKNDVDASAGWAAMKLQNTEGMDDVEKAFYNRILTDPVGHWGEYLEDKKAQLEEAIDNKDKEAVVDLKHTVKWATRIVDYLKRNKPAPVAPTPTAMSAAQEIGPNEISQPIELSVEPTSAPAPAAAPAPEETPAPGPIKEEISQPVDLPVPPVEAKEKTPEPVTYSSWDAVPSEKIDGLQIKDEDGNPMTLKLQDDGSFVAETNTSRIPLSRLEALEAINDAGIDVSVMSQPGAIIPSKKDDETDQEYFDRLKQERDTRREVARRTQQLRDSMRVNEPSSEETQQIPAALADIAVWAEKKNAEIAALHDDNRNDPDAWVEPYMEAKKEHEQMVSALTGPKVPGQIREGDNSQQRPLTGPSVPSRITKGVDLPEAEVDPDKLQVVKNGEKFVVVDGIGRGSRSYGTFESQEAADGFISEQKKNKPDQPPAAAPAAPASPAPAETSAPKIAGEVVGEHQGVKILSIADAAIFREALVKATSLRSDDRLQADVKPVEDYQAVVDTGGKLYLAEDGSFGAFVKIDGYMGSLFKNPESPLTGVAKALQGIRIDEGGRFFDAYATYLEELYVKNGFRPVARMPFNELFAPEGWQESNLKDKPDVVFFAYDPSGDYKAGDGIMTDDWDKAYTLAQEYDTVNTRTEDSATRSGEEIIANSGNVPAGGSAGPIATAEGSVQGRDNNSSNEGRADQGAGGGEVQQSHVNNSQTTQGFFSATVKGENQPLKEWEPLSPLSAAVQRVHDVWKRFVAGFSNHIETNIPAFRDTQLKKINAILNYLPKGGLVIDVGGSQGDFGKTITTMNPSIKTVNLDMNDDMEAAHNATPVEGAVFEKKAFGEDVPNDDGTVVPRYVPAEKADVVHESMLFQFIMPEREDFIKEIADNYIKKDGVVIIEEKMRTTDAAKWKENEEKKDRDFKSAYYADEKIKEKQEKVVAGMTNNQAFEDDLVKALSNNFKYVYQYWDSGNFKGYIASNNKANANRMIREIGDTTTDFTSRDALNRFENGKQVESKPVKKETPENATPQEGDTVAITPQVKGGIDRVMVFADGEWKQSVGGNATRVSAPVQKMAQDQFDKENSPEPESFTTADRSDVSVKMFERPDGENPVYEVQVADATRYIQRAEGMNPSDTAWYEVVKDKDGVWTAPDGSYGVMKSGLLGYTKEEAINDIVKDVNAQIKTGPESVSKRIADAIDAHRNKLKGRNLNSSIFAIPLAIYDTALLVAKHSVLAGASVAEAIDSAIDYVKSRVKDWDNDAQLRDHMNDLADGKKPKASITLTGEPKTALARKKAEQEAAMVAQDRAALQPPAPAASQTQPLQPPVPPADPYQRYAGITHAFTEDERAALGLPGRQQQPEQPNDMLLSIADNEIRNGYNVAGLVNRILKGDGQRNPLEAAILSRYIASLKHEIKNGATNAKIKEYNDALAAAEKGGSAAGSALQAQKLMSPVDGSLADFFIRDLRANGGLALTEFQKAAIEKEFADIEAAKKALEDKLAVLEEEAAERAANSAVSDAGKKSKKQKTKSHEDHVNYRKKVVNDMRAKLKEERGKTPSSPLGPIGLYTKDLIVAAPYVAKIMADLVEEGITNLADIVSNVKDQLSEDIPEITERDVRDLIAGKYNEKKTRSDISKQISDLREEQKLRDKLASLLNKTKQEKNEEHRGQKRNVILDELRQQIKDFKKAEADAARQVRDALDQAQRDLKKAQDDLQKANDKAARDAAKAAERAAKESERLANKKTPEEIALQAVKTRLKNQIDALTTELNAGAPIENKPAVSVQLDDEAIKMKDEVIKLKADRNKRILQQEYAQRTWAQKWLKDFPLEVLNIPRTVMASMDFSAPLRQGIIPTIAHPSVAGPAFARMFQMAFSQKNFDRWFYDVQESPDYNMMKESGLYIADPHDPKLSAKEESFMNNLAEKIPVAGKLIKGSERAYVGYLNKMRVDLFRKMADAFSETDSFENNPELYKGLAKWVNTSTGRGSIGKFEAAAPILNAALFSPRLVAARVNALNPVFYAKLPPKVRQMALLDMLKMVGVVSTVLGVAALAGSGDDDPKAPRVEIDPRSSDFAKIRMGNRRYEITGGFQPYIRLVAQLLAGEKKSLRTGKIKELDGEGAFAESRATALAGFGRGKLAPIPASLVNLLVGKNIIGEKVTLKSELLRNLTPLIASDVAEAMKEDGAKAIATTLLPATFGVGVQQFDAKKKRQKTAN